MNRIGLAAALVALAVAGAGPAAACAIRLSAVSATVAEQLDATDRAVLAVPAGGGVLRVVAAVEGEAAPGDVIPPDALVPRTGVRLGHALLLAHNALAGTWTSLGDTDPANAGGLAAVARSTGDARLALVAPRVEDPDPVVAEIAHDEIARAPYGELAVVAGTLDPAALRAFVAAPGKGAWRPVYILLLGLAGDDGDAAAIDERLGLALERQDATDLAALLAADVELRGPARVAWIEATWLADRSRSLPEVEAALTALAVQGEADATVPRAGVVAAFRRFIRARPAMAGFVAPELAHWQAWEASLEYAALIAAGAVTDSAEEFAILTYLHQSPEPAAKAALAE